MAPHLDTEPPAPGTRTATVLLAAFTTACLAIGIATASRGWIVDDAYISLRFAERMATGQGLTWTAGEPAEGYSNLLWVLANAALIALGIDGVTAVRSLGVTCTLATLFVLLRSPLLPVAAPARLAVAVLASLATTATWAMAGLEGPLVLWLLAVALGNVHRATTPHGPAARWATARAGIAAGLLMWTRPDAPLWAGLLAAFAWTRRRSPNGTAVLRAVIGLSAAAWAAQLAFRLGYHGDWLPNTARAKLTVSSASGAAGLGYLESNATAMRALLLPAALALPALVATRTRGIVAIMLLGTGAWWAYVAAVGGDTFPRGRLLVPSLVTLTVLAAHGIGWLATLGRAGERLAWVVVTCCLGLALFDTHRPSSDPRQQLSTWEMCGQATGEWLARVLAPTQPLLAVDAAGAVPYFSRLPCIDMLGLCDRTIARTPYPTDAPFTPGHSRANGDYVLSRAPDLVMFDLPPGAPRPKWLADRQLEANPKFLADYRLSLWDAGDVRMSDGTTHPVRILVWARLAGRLGARADGQTPRRLVLPAFWLGSHRQPYCFTPGAVPPTVPTDRLLRDVQTGIDWLWDPGIFGVADDGSGLGHPVAEVRRAGRFTLRELPLAPGRWHLDAPSLPSGVALTLQGADGAVAATGNQEFVVHGNGPTTPVDVVCDVPATVATPFRLRHLVLEHRE